MFTQKSTDINDQSGGFQGDTGRRSLKENADTPGISELWTNDGEKALLPTTGVVEQPMQPCPDSATAQHGAKSPQQAVSGAAAALRYVHAISTMAANRKNFEHVACTTKV